MKLLALTGVVATAVTAAACDTRSHVVGKWGSVADGGLPGDEQGDDGGTAGTSDAAVAPNDASAISTPVALAIPPREALTRVARTLWEAPPDSALVAMADSGAITTDADLRKVALEMLSNPRSRVGVAHFYRWWLELDRLATKQKDPVLFPEYSGAVATMMASETESFAVDVTLAGEGRFASLMQASYSFLNETLASIYGVAGVMGPDLRKVDLDPTLRAGLFTQPFFLTLNSDNEWTSPTRRGVFLVRKILCVDVPVPPPSVDAVLDPLPGTLTNRQQLEMQLIQTPCATCHSQFDPVGFAYERFDSIGRVRLTDSGLPIDATGRLIGSASGEFRFDGAVELAATLAKLPEAQRCLASQWLEYTLGRKLEEADGPSVKGIYEVFLADNRNLRSLIAAAVTSPSFLAATGGTVCTPGVDQSCNDSPSFSSIRGTCTPAGKCICVEGAAQNPGTGRCK